MPAIGRIVLETAAAFIALGGCYDLFTPRLPQNLVLQCGSDPRALKLVRELLRALGASLMAIGVTVALLAAAPGDVKHRLLLVLLLVLPAEGVNSFSMRRVGSPFYIPLAFALLTLLGAALIWLNL